MTEPAELALQLARYRRLATTTIIGIVHDVADNGYPSTGSGAGSTGSGTCTCGDDAHSPDPANCPHGTATERAALGHDIDAERARRLLALIDRINRGHFTQTEFVTLVRYAADQLEGYDPDRTVQTIPCPSCTNGRIHRGQALCDNDKCNTRSMAITCVDCGEQVSTAGPKKTRPIVNESRCRPCYDKRYRQRRKGASSRWFTQNDLLETDRVIIANTDDAA